MSGARGGRRGPSPNRAPARPDHADQRGVLPNDGAHQKSDNASLAGPSGVPGPNAFASGRMPSIRNGISRGATLAGVGLGLGAAVSLPGYLGGRSGGAIDLILGAQTPSSRSGASGGDGSPSPNPPPAGFLSMPVLIALIMAGAFVAYKVL